MSSHLFFSSIFFFSQVQFPSSTGSAFGLALLGINKNSYFLRYLYWTWFPFHMLVFTICQTYAVVTPLVSFLGALYFIVIYICTIYQVMIYFPIPEDTGVRRWPKLWRHCTTGLYLSQFLLLGVIILMKGIYQAPFVIALFFLT